MRKKNLWKNRNLKKQQKKTNPKIWKCPKCGEEIKMDSEFAEWYLKWEHIIKKH